MKLIVLAVLALSISPAAIAQQRESASAAPQAQPSAAALATLLPNASAAAPAARPQDVDSIDYIVDALYDVISGAVGKVRDWDRLRSLFHVDARMMPTGQRAGGGNAVRTITVNEYIERSGKFLVEQGFREAEIGRRVEEWGNIAHVWSTYEARKLDETAPFMRGINSIQLFNDGKRWWVMSIMWQQESPAAPLPEKYLK